MKREFNVQANVGRPQVAYRETIRTKVEAEGKYIRQTGGRGQYGHCLIILEPQEPGKGFEFVDAIKGGRIPREYIPAVEKGIVEAMESGVLAGYPVVDIKCTVFDGSYHDVDSSEMAFKIAGSMAFKDGAKRAKPVLLEPVMKFEVVTPEDYMGTIIGDLNSRRAQVNENEQRGNAARHSRHRSSGRDVRIRDDRAFAQPGPRVIQFRAESLCGSAEKRGGRNYQ